MQFKRLLIRDFGPIREIEFNFEENKVYHFIGENDSGKSMVLDAMNILCNNIPDIHVQKYVSDYSNSFYIEGEDFSGNIIGLKRGNETWYYLKTPDGKEKYWEKIRGNVPDEIQRIVNMYEDDVKKEKFNFRYAEDKILFMNTTSGENYSFFQKALGTDKVIQALKKANTEDNKLGKELEKIEAKLEYEKENLAKHPDLTYIKDEVTLYRNSVKEIYVNLKGVHELIETYRYLDNLETLKVPDEISNWGSYEEDYKKIESIYSLLSDMRKLEEIELRIKQGEEVLNLYETVRKEKEKHRGIREINLYNNKLDLIYETLCFISDVEHLKCMLDADLDVFDELTEVIIKIKEIDSMNKELGKADEIIGKYKDIKRLEEACKETSVRLGEVEHLIDFLERLKNILNVIKKQNILIKKSQEELDNFMIENKFCPVVVGRKDKKCPFSKKSLEDLVV